MIAPPNYTMQLTTLRRAADRDRRWADDVTDSVRCFTIDCTDVRSLANFVAAVNVGFVRLVRGECSGNLDALNDYLSYPTADEFELEVIGAASPAVCPRSLCPG